MYAVFKERRYRARQAICLPLDYGLIRKAYTMRMFGAAKRQRETETRSGNRDGNEKRQTLCGGNVLTLGPGIDGTDNDAYCKFSGIGLLNFI